MSRVHKHGHNTGWFWCTSWRANVHIIWPVDAKKITAYIKRTFDLDYVPSPGPFGGRCIEIHDNGYDAQVLCFMSWKGDDFDHGALAHEAMHATEHILTARGMKLTPDTTEAYAYLVQEIVDRSLQIINKKPR